jgi:hypothetical protein
MQVSIAVVDRVVAQERVEPEVAPRFALALPHHTASHNRFAVPMTPVVAPAIVVLRLPLSHSKKFYYRTRLPYLFAKHITIITF